MFIKLVFPAEDFWSGLEVGENDVVGDKRVKMFKLKVVQAFTERCKF